MIIKRLFFVSFLCAIMGVKALGADEKWCIIGDDKVLMPVSSVVCLIGSDATGLITVIGNETQVPDINEVKFAPDPTGGINSPIVATDSAILIDNILRINCATPGARVQIHNVDAHLVFSETLKSENIEIDMSNYASGIYFVSIGDSSTFKLLKR